MSFITGLLLIDAPASALNNLGNIPGARTDNTVGVKVIRSRDGSYPYVSAQAFRYWLRTTLETRPNWKAAPIYREEKVAYTDSNPIRWWDDDLFGYMRAQSNTSSAAEKRAADASRVGETPTNDTVTRVSPFRVSTLVSIAPVNLTEDFGVMSRHDGDPVPHEHQFYRATLKGLFSLDLRSAGTFSYRKKSGFRNLDDERISEAKIEKLEHLEGEKSYRLAAESRLERISALLDGMARLEGGAKQAIHYTDVTPPLVIMAVTRGGNHIFANSIGASTRGLPFVKTSVLEEVIRVYADELLSDIYVGWAEGYLDDEHLLFNSWASEKERIKILHPREAYQALIQDINENTSWLE